MIKYYGDVRISFSYPHKCIYIILNTLYTQNYQTIDAAFQNFHNGRVPRGPTVIQYRNIEYSFEDDRGTLLYFSG